MSDTSQKSYRPPGLRAVVALCCALVGFATTAAVFLVAAQNSSDAVAEQRTAVASAEITEVRLAITRTALDEATVRVGVMAGTLDKIDLDRAADARRIVWSEARTALERIAGEQDVLAAEAQFLVTNLDVEEPVLLGDLYEVAGVAQFDGRPGLESVDSAEADLEFIDQAFTLVLYEAFIAEAGRTGATSNLLPKQDIDFIKSDIDYIADNPGYLGPDASAPLNNGWFPYSAAEVESAARLQDVNDLLAESNTFDVEQSTRQWGAGSTAPPPVPLTDFSFETAQNVAIVRAVTDGHVAAQIDQALSAATAAKSDASAARLAGGGAALLVVVVLGALVTTAVRRLRWTKSLAGTDALTGAGNRRRLDQTSARLKDPSMPHHIVIVIDLDRFKLVNDTHGHAMGDRVLIEVARRLESVGSACKVRAHELIRLGGDEFMLALHHDLALDTSAISDRLEAVQANVVTTPEGEAIPLSFSFGHVVAEGSPSLTGLMDAADLQAYRDKDRRRQNRSAESQITTENSELTL